MRTLDIHDYTDLEKYIRLQLALQTTTKNTAEIELPERWFIKLVKLIHFCLKESRYEFLAKKELEELLLLNQFYVHINRVSTLIIKQ